MEQENTPYTAPASDVGQGENETLEIILASRTQRFFNYIIDYLGMFILVVILMVTLGLLLDEASVNQVERIPDFLFGLLLMLLYYLPLEVMSGRTLGKLITGTKVVNEEGLKASFAQVAGRTFSRMVPFEALSFFNSEARGWHDSWSHTYVVKCR